MNHAKPALGIPKTHRNPKICQSSASSYLAALLPNLPDSLFSQCVGVPRESTLLRELCRP
jgi:hypothetical protein